MNGNLKTVAMYLPDHFSQIVWRRIQLASAFVQHDFDTAKPNLGSLPVGLLDGGEVGLARLRESLNPNHHCCMGTYDPVGS